MTAKELFDFLIAYKFIDNTMVCCGKCNNRMNLKNCDSEADRCVYQCNKTRHVDGEIYKIPACNTHKTARTNT